VQPIEHYEALLYSRRKLQDWVRDLTPERYTQEFAFGHKSVRGTLTHLASAEWLIGKRVRGEEFSRGDLPFTEASYPDYSSLEADWRHLEASTRAWLESEKDWTRRIEQVTNVPGGKRVRIAYTPEKLAFHMFYHEVHHRAQVMAMLRHMGISVENLDFSRHAYEWTELE
jgi:uncharacterized damage-inducible protein DinB